MCQRVECSACHKPSYVGCGLHVEQVLQGVPPEKRCHCREDRHAAGKNKGSFLGRLFRKL